MINSTGINQPQDFSSEGNFPPNEAKKETGNVLSVNKLKSYGKKSLSPLVELAHKYQDEITPYFDAIAKGLQAGSDALGSSGGEVSEAEKVVGGWFKEAAGGLNGARSKLTGGSPQDIIDYIEAQAEKYPGVMFSTSYLVGLFFGRIGRHIGRKATQSSGTSTTLTQ